MNEERHLEGRHGAGRFSSAGLRPGIGSRGCRAGRPRADGARNRARHQGGVTTAQRALSRYGIRLSDRAQCRTRETCLAETIGIGVPDPSVTCDTIEAELSRNRCRAPTAKAATTTTTNSTTTTPGCPTSSPPSSNDHQVTDAPTGQPPAGPHELPNTEIRTSRSGSRPFNPRNDRRITRAVPGMLRNGLLCEVRLRYCELPLVAGQDLNLRPPGSFGNVQDVPPRYVCAALSTISAVRVTSGVVLLGPVPGRP